MNLILPTPVQMYAEIVSTEGARWVWEAGMRWKSRLLCQIHHWDAKMNGITPGITLSPYGFLCLVTPQL